MTSPHPTQQATDAYKQMATKARYRPAAPSDGYGHITTPLKDLNLNTEAKQYATHWWTHERDSIDYMIGCPSYEDRKAFIYIIEAARNTAAVNRPTAIDLLQLAIQELKAQEKK